MMKRNLITLFALAVLLSVITASVKAQSARPNIIFILADDYGVGEVSAYGADNYKTPNIDALAKSGTRYTRAYTPSLCGPSRATILTGRYLFRTGATNQDATGRFTPDAETMMPKILKTAGYVTAAVGKWGQLPLGPGEFGFDQYLKFQGSGTYWNTQDRGKKYLVNGRQVPLRDREYLPDLMHQFVTDFITKNHDKPFYLYYSMSHVHSDILPTPDSAPDSKDVYADNVTYMDKLVGKLVAELDRQKLREKTLIVFLGDNGTANPRSDRATIGGRRLAGAKGSMLEGGNLVPMIVNWPGVTPAGKVRADMIDSSDFVPTFAELAGAKLPAKTVIDGRSFVASIRGEKKQVRDWVFLQLANKWYTREAGWKLTQAGELFDMSDAPFAEKLVPADTKDTAAIAARKRLQAALDQLNPAGGILDDGDGSGRHAKNVEREKKKKEK
ncbi:MAG TPA: sulfatase-like hydrolase/transferase [Blastocatellia bacterium]|nr:sulfatase-like hydrolase/transferase [Blastocatellia bacterium]